MASLAGAVFPSDEFGDSDDDALLEAAAGASSQSPLGLPKKRKFDERPSAHEPDINGSQSVLPFGARSRVASKSRSGSKDDVQPQELFEDIPSDLFASPSQGSTPKTYRQATLFGQVPTKRRPPPKAVEPPTHHELDLEAAKTWVYPINVGSVRDYQRNITQKGLFSNLLVALPTGLGKTFIAATIMLNWYRWAPKGKLIFMAPTKPLVSQQMEACCMIAGIPRSDSIILTGSMKPALRAQEWANRRVFFCTPQVVQNDVSHGMCDPKTIVCLIVDEAHRATGNYAYVEVTRNIRRFNNSFRVLALTATPGSNIEAVQQVIDSLGISDIAIRTEHSLDIRQYVFSRNEEIVVVDLSEDITLIKNLYCNTLQPLLDELHNCNATWIKDAEKLSAFGLTEARRKWQASAGQNANRAQSGMVHALFTILSQLAHPMSLLVDHGIVPFHHAIEAYLNDTGKSQSKYRQRVVDAADFRQMRSQIQEWVNDPAFLGHPKMEHLIGFVLQHFTDQTTQRETRIMIFAQFRDSAEEIVRVLKQHSPMIKPRIFVGQAKSKVGTAGMAQKEQIGAIDDFQKGVFNVLVATSIGEEGLDIGEVDLIVCYDASSSPIRMLQRMGRTGRKRAGEIVLLLTRGKEENKFQQAKDAYEKMQTMIAAGDRFDYSDPSPRILPKGVVPVIDQRMVDIPVENSQPEPAKRANKKLKKPPKKFFMPDGAVTGFMKASRMEQPEAVEVENPADYISAGEGGLATELEYVFETVDVSAAVICAPRLDAFPQEQHQLRPVAKIAHGRIHLASLLTSMIDVDLEKLQENAPLGTSSYEAHSFERQDMPSPISSFNHDEDDIKDFVVADSASISSVSTPRVKRHKRSLSRESASSLESNSNLRARLETESDSEDLPDIGAVKDRIHYKLPTQRASQRRRLIDFSDSEDF